MYRFGTCLIVDPCCDPGKSMHKEAKKKIPREAYKNDGTSMWPQNEHDCRARKGKNW